MTGAPDAPPERGAPVDSSALASPWPARPLAMMALAVLLPVFVYVISLWARDPGPRWKVEYFRGHSFQDGPIVRRERDASIHVRRDAPVPGVEVGKFSARWHSCLQVGGGTSVVFGLSSDDGSRALLNGELLIDNWGRHARRTRAAVRVLPEGSHHILVEYAPRRLRGRMGLLASFDGREPSPIPADRLRYPSEGASPCSP
jgi:hypothetical protein